MNNTDILIADVAASYCVMLLLCNYWVNWWSNIWTSEIPVKFFLNEIKHNILAYRLCQLCIAPKLPRDKAF